MYLLVNSSTPVCEIIFFENKKVVKSDKWESGRNLARDLIGYLESQLKNNNKSFNDIDGIGVFEGPGSFTGLRIGITVLNTISNSQNIPIVGARGDSWINEATTKLERGVDEKMILPFYGKEANITISKK